MPDWPSSTVISKAAPSWPTSRPTSRCSDGSSQLVYSGGGQRKTARWPNLWEPASRRSSEATEGKGLGLDDLGLADREGQAGRVARRGVLVDHTLGVGLADRLEGDG